MGSRQLVPQIAWVPVEQLHEAEWNPRKLRGERFKNLCRSIEADPDLLARRTILALADGTVYAGNMRFRAACKLGWPAVPAIVEDVPPKLARERALRDNAQWGEWEPVDLAAMLEEMRVEGSDLTVVGFEPVELDELLALVNGKAEPPDDPGPQLDRADELQEKWQVQEGDLWRLGEHVVARLGCACVRMGHRMARDGAMRALAMALALIMALAVGLGILVLEFTTMV